MYMIHEQKSEDIGWQILTQEFCINDYFGCLNPQCC